MFFLLFQKYSAALDNSFIYLGFAGSSPTLPAASSVERGRKGDAVPIQEDGHLQAVTRYVERNALRANLCQNAEDWFYGSLWRR